MKKVNQTKKQPKIRIAILGLSAFQLLMYAWAGWIIVQANLDSTKPELYGLGAILPMVLFIMFGCLNFLLVIIHVTKLAKRHKPQDSLVICITLALILLTFFSGHVTEYLETAF